MNTKNVKTEYLEKIDADIKACHNEIKSLDIRLSELQALRNQISISKSESAIEKSKEVAKQIGSFSSGQAERQKRERETRAAQIDNFLDSVGGIATSTEISANIGVGYVSTLKTLKVMGYKQYGTHKHTKWGKRK